MILEVPDLDRDQALQYLKLQGLSNKLALQAYELVGGSLFGLQSVAFGLNYRTFEGTGGCSTRP